MPDARARSIGPVGDHCSDLPRRDRSITRSAVTANGSPNASSSPNSSRFWSSAKRGRTLPVIPARPPRSGGDACVDLADGVRGAPHPLRGDQRRAQRVVRHRSRSRFVALSFTAGGASL